MFRWHITWHLTPSVIIDRTDGAQSDSPPPTPRGEVRIVEIITEVDAPDELAARDTVNSTLPPMLALLPVRVAKLGLAPRWPTRPDHYLHGSGSAPKAAIAHLHETLDEALEGLDPTLRRSETEPREILIGYLEELADPMPAQIPLPDDDALISAIVWLWEPLAAAGVRATGPAFEISEAKVRARFRKEAAADDGGLDWDGMATRLIAAARRQGRLVP